MDLHLNPHGPHSGDYTRAVANGLSECVRVLIYAARTEDGVPYPNVSADVLGSLAEAVSRMDQLLPQLAASVDRHRGTGRLYAYQGSADVVSEALLDSMGAARRAADQLARHLGDARNAAALLGLREED